MMEQKLTWGAIIGLLAAFGFTAVCAIVFLG